MDYISILKLTRSECDRLPSTRAGPCHRVVVNAVIFSRQHFATKILLLRPKAKDIYRPHLLEFPGGLVQHSDKNVLEALKRHVRETVGIEIRAEKVVDGVRLFNTHNPEGAKGGLRKTTVHFSFLCEVEDMEFQLKRDEYVEGMFYSWRQLDRCMMTDDVRGVLEDSFAVLG